jgi:hypothetical protein
MLWLHLRIIAIQKMSRSYRELKRLTTFQERFDYLKLNGNVSGTTFGSERYLNQLLYTSSKWRKTRADIIIRDEACDLGIPGRLIYGSPVVHHMNPITIEDIEEDRYCIYDPDNLITTHTMTHKAITFGSERLLQKEKPPRQKGDTDLWSRRN